MVLAWMIALDEDALICDLAETYHVFDYKSLPLHMAATLACGLRDNSRIRAKSAGHKVGLDTILAVKVVDILENLRWMFSKEGQEGKNPPEPILPSLVEIEEPQGRFESAVAFEEYRASLLQATPQKE